MRKTNTTAPASNEEFEQVSGNYEEIVKFYQFNAGKKPNPKAQVLAVGDVLLGTYEGNFAGTGKYKKSLTHKIRTEDGLVGLSGAGGLNKDLSKVAIGTRVRIEYLGKEEIQKGEWAGSEAHTFDVKQAKGAPTLAATTAATPAETTKYPF